MSSINSIKAEICQLLGLISISASEAKVLPQASELVDPNWSKKETWEKLLLSVRAYAFLDILKAETALEASTTNDTINNDVSTTNTVQPPLKLNLGGLNLGISSPVPQPVVTESKEPINLKERSKRANLYAAVTDSGEALINSKVNSIKAKTLTTLEQYEQLLKSQNKLGTKAIVFYYHIGIKFFGYIIKVDRNTTEKHEEIKTDLIEAKKQELEEKQAKAIKALTKQSDVDAELTTTIATEISKVNFKDIAVRRQRRILEDSGMAFNINTDLRQVFKSLWKLLENIEISDEITERLLIQQHNDSYNNKVYSFIYANLNNKLKQQFATKFNFNAPLTIIETHQDNHPGIFNLSKQKPGFNLTRQDNQEFDNYLSTIEFIESKNKDTRTESEQELIEIHQLATKEATNHLLANYTVDIQMLSLKQWTGICLDNLGISADKEKGKSRWDVYLESIDQLEIRSNPVSVISHLLYENIYHSNDVVEVVEINHEILATIDRYAVNRTVAEFKDKYPEFLLIDLAHNYGELRGKGLSHNHKVWFNKKLVANRKIVKDWLLANKTYKPKKLKDDFRKLYSLLTKTTDYKPSNLNIADEQLKQSYRPSTTLDVIALPVSLTSHFTGKEQVGDKYRKSPVAQGKMRTSAINDRSLNNLLPNIPLYCRQKLGDIIVMLKQSPVENRLIDIVWCDKSTLDKGTKDLIFNPIGSLSTKKIQNRNILMCKLVPKFVTLANKHNLGNGTNALYYVLAALDNWGLKDNHPVTYNPDGHIKIDEKKEAEKIFASTDNKKLEKYLADKYALGKNLKFIPIWSELIESYFYLKFTPVTIDNNPLVEVKDLREIRKINNFKSQYPQAKQVATNPISRLVYQVRNNSLDKLDDREEVVSKKREISAKEYYSLIAANKAIEADEVVLKDGSILRRVKQVERHVNRLYEEIVTGIDHKDKNKPIIEKRLTGEETKKIDAGYKYYLINERRVNTWHY